MLKIFSIKYFLYVIYIFFFLIFYTFYIKIRKVYLFFYKQSEFKEVQSTETLELLNQKSFNFDDLLKYSISDTCYNLPDSSIYFKLMVNCLEHEKIFFRSFIDLFLFYIKEELSYYYFPKIIMLNNIFFYKIYTNSFWKLFFEVQLYFLKFGFWSEILIFIGILLYIVYFSLVFKKEILQNKVVNLYQTVNVLLFLLVILMVCYIESFLGLYNTSVFIFNYLLIITPYNLFFKFFIVFITILNIFLSKKVLKYYKIYEYEYVYFILFSLMGSIISLSSFDFLTLFCGLEIMNLSLYILAAFVKNSQTSLESSTKYLIMGSLSTGIFLKGVSFFYFILNTTNFFFLDIFEIPYIYNFYTDISIFIFIAIFLVTLSFLFKLGIFPFHIWVADVYGGVSMPITFFFATVIKSAIFLTFLSICFRLGWVAIVGWEFLFLFLGICSIIIGAFGAFNQLNIKRFLAYSSINHAGFLILFLAFYNDVTLSNSIFYLFIYILTMVGLFGILVNIVGIKVYTNIEDVKFKKFNNIKFVINTISDLQNLNKVKPFICFIISIYFFSLGGIPPLLGFFPKYLVLQMLLDSGYFFFLFILLFSSIFSLGYYLRVIKIIFFDKTPLILSNISYGTKILVNDYKIIWKNINIYVICIVLLILFFLIFGIFYLSYIQLFFVYIAESITSPLDHKKFIELFTYTLNLNELVFMFFFIKNFSIVFNSFFFDYHGVNNIQDFFTMGTRGHGIIENYYFIHTKSFLKYIKFKYGSDSIEYLKVLVDCAEVSQLIKFYMYPYLYMFIDYIPIETFDRYGNFIFKDFVIQEFLSEIYIYIYTGIEFTPLLQHTRDFFENSHGANNLSQRTQYYLYLDAMFSTLHNDFLNMYLADSKSINGMDTIKNLKLPDINTLRQLRISKTSIYYMHYMVSYKNNTLDLYGIELAKGSGYEYEDSTYIEINKYF